MKHNIYFYAYSTIVKILYVVIGMSSKYQESSEKVLFCSLDYTDWKNDYNDFVIFSMSFDLCNL